MNTSVADISPIEEIIEDFAQGKMVILVDDEARENEGDLFIAAELALPEHVNFMATYGRGLICLTLTTRRCQQLRLPLMVNEKKDSHDTAFTISIEAASGTTTGISATDRATTIRAAAAKEARPEDIKMPGHVFPLQAREGGVLIRPGHTEAGCDLARLAGYEPASVIVEVMKEDGDMARLPDLQVFAKKHNIKLGTIADLIRHRIKKENIIERISSCQLPTRWGEFRLISYQNMITKKIHCALVYGDIDTETSVLTRVHMFNALSDSFQSTHSDAAWGLSNAMQQIANAGKGLIVVLRTHDSDMGLLQEMEQCQQMKKGINLLGEQGWDHKLYGEGAQIIMDLGIKRLKLIGNKVDLVALDGFDLTVDGYVEKQG